MILFGTRTITDEVGSGAFPCPGCKDASAAFSRKRVRRFVTVYRLPVLSLATLGEYVECGACSATWRVEVLARSDLDTGERAGFVAEYKRVMLRVMVQMMMADGAMDEAEVITLRDIYTRLGGEPLSDEAITAQVRDLGQGECLQATCRRAGPLLNDHGKVIVLRAALDVAYADGEFAEAEREMVAAIARALDMRARDISEVMDAAR